MAFIVRALKDNVLAPVMQVFQAGVSTDAIGAALAYGFYCGCFPVPGVTSVVALAAAWLLSLNIVVLMAANYAATPVNLATFLVFIRYGERLLGMHPVAVAIEPFRENFLEALQTFGGSLAAGVLMWLVCMPFVVVPIRYGSAWIMNRFDRRGAAKESAGKNV
eukprot:c49065_g1_i1.p1 GENE.c49065_g1_i1~~c49065_g1_i1.p1  ORF type:complete len:163 (+),score=28.32 c49065_g1_i1:102-590(+)